MAKKRATARLQNQKAHLFTRSPLRRVRAGLFLAALTLLAACSSEGTPQGQPTLSDLASEVRLEGVFGEAATGSFEFGNGGNGPLEYRVSEPGVDWLEVTAGGAGRLAPRGVATVGLRGTCPDTGAETRSTSLTLQSNASAEKIKVSLACKAGAQPVLGVLSPDALELETYKGQTVESQFSFSNQGSAPLHYTLALPGEAAWLRLGKREGTVQPGGDAEVPVQATCPASGADPEVLETTVRVQPDAPAGGANLTVRLSCTTPPSTPQPLLGALSPNPLVLSAEVGETAENSFNFSNGGNAPLRYTLSGASWLEFSASGGTVTPGGSAEVEVRATCTGTGEKTSAVTVTGNDPATPSRTLAVTLRCSEQKRVRWELAPLSLSVSSAVGANIPAQKATLKNVGDASGDYRLTSNQAWLTVEPGTGTLGAGASRSLNLAVASCAASGEATATLTVEGGGERAQLTLTRRCTQAAPPQPTPPPPSQPTVDLELTRFYINQAVPAADSAQAPKNQIPLVAGRGGLARAFVTADAANTNAAVRLHYRDASGKKGTLDLKGPRNVPTTPREGDLGNTFNAALDGSLLRPGLEVYIEVDPDNAVAETDETNNRYPASGYVALPVQNTPTLNVTLVPVTYQGATPDITNATKARYMDAARRMHPLGETNVSVHSPYAFNGDLDTINGWDELLRAVTTLRGADGSDSLYYAVVDPRYSSGVSGLGWIGFPVAVGWDDPTTRGEVAAHEFGHTWGREHAFCKEGGAIGDADASYPYPNARTGVWGYDAGDGSLRDPAKTADIMSYCGPRWVSDYTYKGVLDFRQESVRVQTSSVRSTNVLLVSGSLQNGKLSLNPAFSLTTTPQPPAPGSYTLVGLDASGKRLFSVPFGVFETSQHDPKGGERAGFNFSIPLSAARAAELVSLQVKRNGVLVAENATRISPQSLRPTQVTRLGNGQVELRWDAARYGAVMVRDGDGTVLAIDKSGTVTLRPNGNTLELLLSNGVQTIREVVKF